MNPSHKQRANSDNHEINASHYEDSSVYALNCLETEYSSSEIKESKSFITLFLENKISALQSMDDLEDNSKIEIELHEPIILSK